MPSKSAWLTLRTPVQNECKNHEASNREMAEKCRTHADVLPRMAENYESLNKRVNNLEGVLLRRRLEFISVMRRHV